MKKILVLIALVVVSISYAQNIRLEGTVQDKAKLSLEMANVMAVNQTTKAMDAYAITTDKGKFSLNLKTNTTYVISYLGAK
jgi:hypothetical protein